MIAAIKRRTTRISKPAWHAAFLAMVPAIRRQARISFRNAQPELREELIQEVVANCFAAYARLVELGKEELAFPSALARFAIVQVRVGRRVGSRLRIGDAMSRYAQHKKGFQVERLDQFHEESEEWQEVLIEDRRAGPAEIAACRIDFESWLRLLPRRRRKIALALASGETTTAAAKKFGVTAARISQLRQWLKRTWDEFQGEATTEEQPQLVVA